MKAFSMLPRLQIALFGALGLLVAATVYVAALTSQQQEALHRADHDKIALAASRISNEYHRAIYELDRHLRLPEVDAEEARLRLEILLARRHSMFSGELGGFLKGAPAESLHVAQRLHGVLEELAPLVERLGEPGVARTVLNRLHPMDGDMVALAAQADDYEARQVAAHQDRLSRLQWLFSGFAAALIGVSLVLSMLLTWSKRSLNRVYDELVVTAADLSRQTEHLKRRNTLFDAAINHMSQGLCMFGAEGDLIVANTRFAKLYGLPESIAGEGATVNSVVDRCAVAGVAPRDRLMRMFGTADQEASQSWQRLEELYDGRVIAVNLRPIADGGWVVTHEDVTKRQRAEERLAYIARNDTLTDLVNRNSFRDLLDQAIGRYRSRGERCAVVCFDLDRFKNVNDTLGHGYGDLLLKSVSTRIRSIVREADVVARFGGDEFAVLLQGVSGRERAVAFAERLIDALTEPHDLEGHKVIIGVSVGITLVEDATLSADVVIKHADTALYRAKLGGGNDCRVFEPVMDAGLQTRRALELELWSAFEHGEFELAYQPQVSLRDYRVNGVEALLRWKHPERGYISPAEFVPVAEDIGLIEPLGAWVLNTACREVAGWPKPVKVAVNLSPVQFTRGDLLATVTAALQESGLPAEQLELEITESLFLHENAAILDMLQRLKEMGIRLALDDFGTGYSSLSYIRRFPIDKIKIDKSFVEDIVSDNEALAIVRAVTTLGHSLDISTTAEGIETVDQMRLLHLAGCSEGQGYLFSRPVDNAEIVRVLRRTEPFVKEAV